MVTWPLPKARCYAYRADDGSVYVTLINKTFADAAQALAVSFQLPTGLSATGTRQMDLVQKNNDVAAQTDITLVGAPIDSQGVWTGQWKAAETGSARNPTIAVAPASATIVHFYGAR